MTIFAGVTLVACVIGIKEKSLERKHETDQGLGRGRSVKK